MSTSPYVTVAQAADELDVGTRHIRYLCNKGLIGDKMGKHWVITRNELEDYKKTRNQIKQTVGN